MSFDRVIQDSDDEDDPLLEERPPRAHPPPVIHQSDHRASYRDTSNDPLNDESNRQIAVNFDQFLGSQEGGQVGTTSSQQRREERWIPANAGGGSIGTMMNEIGLAQQRLFDDEDAHHGSALLDPYGSNGFGTMAEYNDEYVAPQQPEIHIQSTTPSGSYVSLPPPDGSSNDYMYNPDNTQSATSYNIFESSLRPSESTYSENNTTLKSHQTIPTEAIQKSPRRWNSTQGTISSPHDTEPNSSILAAKSSRSISNNNPSPNGPQQPPASIDELSFPVEAEPPVVGKKRGRPKKQSLPDVDGDDELAQSAGYEAEPPPMPEKRKPGRPPKNAKNPDANKVTAIPDNQADDAQPIAQEPEPKEPSDQNPTIVADTFHAANQIEDHPIDSPKTKKTAKEPAKKKLKRGKTTSVTLQKTYESDVEDDVIWVESRPSNPAAPQDTNSASFSINIEPPAPQKPTENKQTDTVPDQAAVAAAAAADQAPKKRGRKRKKTSEEAPPVEPTESTPDINPNTNTSNPLDTHNQPEPSDSNPSTPPLNANSSTQPPPPSPTKEQQQQQPPPPDPPITPQKPTPQTPTNASTSNNNNSTTQSSSKGPDKHSPISSTSKVPYRVGLSRRARIAPLLKIVKR